MCDEGKKWPRARGMLFVILFMIHVVNLMNHPRYEDCWVGCMRGFCDVIGVREPARSKIIIYFLISGDEYLTTIKLIILSNTFLKNKSKNVDILNLIAFDIILLSFTPHGTHPSSCFANVGLLRKK